MILCSASNVSDLVISNPFDPYGHHACLISGWGLEPILGSEIYIFLIIQGEITQTRHITMVLLQITGHGTFKVPWMHMDTTIY